MLTKLISRQARPSARAFSSLERGSMGVPAAGIPPVAAFNTPNFYNPKPHEEDSRLIKPNFWTGESYVPVETVQIDCSQFDMKKILSARNADGEIIAAENSETDALRAQMKDLFQRTGIVHMINTGHTSSDALAALTRVLKPADPIVYEGGANMRAPIEKNVYDTGAPQAADILYHNEIAYLHQSPKWVSFCALQATGVQERGATFVASGVGATELMMQNPLGEKLRRKGLCYVRKLPDQKYFLDNGMDSSIVYNFWQTSTLTEDMDEAAEIMRRKGLEVEWETSPLFGRYMVTKFYTSAFEYDPFTDANLLYASVADDYMWFDSWPGVMELPHHERPLKLNFGDGEVLTRDEKMFWHDCFAQCGVPVNWKQGDFAVICNYRWLHGRPKYELLPGEKRELGVILGETYDRQHEQEGKWKQFGGQPIDESLGRYQKSGLPRLDSW